MYYRLRFGRNCVCPLGVSIQNFSKLLCPVPSFPFRILYIYVSMCPEPSLMQCVRVSKPWPLKKATPRYQGAVVALLTTVHLILLVSNENEVGNCMLALRPKGSQSIAGSSIFAIDMPCGCCPGAVVAVGLICCCCCCCWAAACAAYAAFGYGPGPSSPSWP